MKFSPFIVLLIPLWIYIRRYGTKVIQNQEVSIDYYPRLMGENRTKLIKGKLARLFGYSTVIGGMLISIGILATLFSDSAPYHAGLLYVTVCPIGIGINIVGVILSAILEGKNS